MENWKICNIDIKLNGSKENDGQGNAIILYIFQNGKNLKD